MSGEEISWELVDEDGNLIGLVRDAKMNGGTSWLTFPDRTIRREYDGDNVCRLEVEQRKHHLRREWELEESGRQTIRHYWRSVRVPWIIWAMFS